ncbi:ABC-type multidrug transport system fused ATPase/permease subunit [Saccharopolyspora erythraea NRRL 2338]|uniref:ABC transporter, ATP-binding/permease protein n=2 Tax=Saccharopolyspora erythraea TaxID=1836 RepID=A4FQI9_SACEN|nr:ABC transporter ATP-binding protein [Saccharopolyspora erythraea]EQD86599.1 multidrug ABC transporter permease [Saccharopolyspora erythraea D]PFG92917.1 ABC-type multidrug transport system fused ATPase/permease subunit [Saccharopolyspora erythraea NRRL 2338]QRK89817.1 ABC transporter ATP-binding protein [Saccharopolyspora erythraea]CAM06314.1 ABC transporter, ATP-binding/permease protein [Saccharopolyspora erythraea NRRL 2338]
MTPDTRGSSRFLWSLLRRRPGLPAIAVLTGALWMLPTALMPLAIGNAIDGGIRTGEVPVLLAWLLVVLGLGAVQTASAAGLEWVSHTMWIDAAATSQRLALAHVARLGATLTRKVRAGEVVAIGSSDIYRIAALFEVIGRAAGSLVSFAIAAGVVLALSPVMGAVVLVGVPLATIGIGPLLSPLHRREEVQRERVADLNALATDIVSGLRILRGVGGESRFHARFVESSQRVRAAGVASGRVEAWLAFAEILLPGLVTVLVTWLGARLALAGTISVGELVAFYGVSAFLVIPVRTATEAAYSYATAKVAARHMCGLLRTRPEPGPPERPRPLDSGPLALRDESRGLEIAAGKLTVIDAGADGEALAERLAGHRFVLDGEAAGGHEQAPSASSDGRASEANARAGERPAVENGSDDRPAEANARDARGRVLANGVPLDEVAPAELRRRIVLAHNQDLLFSGPVHTELDLGTAVDVPTALHTADAHDVIEALPADAVLDERARSLSGGQRQRLVLARALCSDADVLVLDEPTSAVDAHTEARIVRRVRELRAGRTTVVLSQSPLWRQAADETATLEGRTS